MNSNCERRSAADMRQMQKQSLAQAAAAQPTVAVMEPNWKAMISSQEQQVQTLAQILELLALLATEERITALMQEQIDFLTECQDNSEAAMQAYQERVTKAAKDAEKLMQAATKAIEVRSGEVSEKFSKAISEEQQSLRKWMLRCLLISLIPSVLQVILLLTQLI